MQKFSLSEPYYQSALGFVYKENDGHITEIVSLMTPLETNLWVAIVGILGAAIFIILMSKKLTQKWRHFYIGGRMNRTPILNMWTTVLGHPIANPRIATGQSIGNFSRTLIILWITLWFIIRSSYEGALYRFLQSRPTSPFDTVEKVLTSDAKIISSLSTYGFVRKFIKRDR